MCQLNVLTEALPLQNILKLVRRRFEKIWTSLRRNCENVCIKRGTSVIHFSLFYCWCYSRCFSLSFSVLRQRNFPVSFCRLCSQRQKRRSRREKSQQKRPKVISMSLIHIYVYSFFPVNRFLRVANRKEFDGNTGMSEISRNTELIYKDTEKAGMLESRKTIRFYRTQGLQYD